MFSMTRKNTSILLCVVVLFAASLACNINYYREEIGDPIDSEAILVKQCLVSPDLYKIEFANIHTESDDTGQLCRVDYMLSNFSDERLVFKSYYVLDDSGEHSEKWLVFTVNPGDILAAASSFKSTSENFPPYIGTYTKEIVFTHSPECINVIRDENIATWEEYTLPLDDPCN